MARVLNPSAITIEKFRAENRVSTNHKKRYATTGPLPVFPVKTKTYRVAVEQSMAIMAYLLLWERGEGKKKGKKERNRTDISRRVHLNRWFLRADEAPNVSDRHGAMVMWTGGCTVHQPINQVTSYISREEAELQTSVNLAPQAERQPDRVRARASENARDFVRRERVKDKRTTYLRKESGSDFSPKID